MFHFFPNFLKYSWQYSLEYAVKPFAFHSFGRLCERQTPTHLSLSSFSFLDVSSLDLKFCILFIVHVLPFFGCPCYWVSRTKEIIAMDLGKGNLGTGILNWVSWEVQVVFPPPQEFFTPKRSRKSKELLQSLMKQNNARYSNWEDRQNGGIKYWGSL